MITGQTKKLYDVFRFVNKFGPECKITESKDGLSLVTTGASNMQHIEFLLFDKIKVHVNQPNHCIVNTNQLKSILKRFKNKEDCKIIFGDEIELKQGDKYFKVRSYADTGSHRELPDFDFASHSEIEVSDFREVCEDALVVADDNAGLHMRFESGSLHIEVEEGNSKYSHKIEADGGEPHETIISLPHLKNALVAFDQLYSSVTVLSENQKPMRLLGENTYCKAKYTIAPRVKNT
jgi:DNA polymerase III sliding clamp (beta) subunit (PCNA family)